MKHNKCSEIKVGYRLERNLLKVVGAENEGSVDATGGVLVAIVSSGQLRPEPLCVPLSKS
jgi:hypothetical protein